MNDYHIAPDRPDWNPLYTRRAIIGVLTGGTQKVDLRALRALLNAIPDQELRKAYNIAFGKPMNEIGDDDLVGTESVHTSSLVNLLEGAPPCDCGCPDAGWHDKPGSDTGRIYCCDACFKTME